MSEITSEQLALITLVGSPNSGKTTLFNQLSGQNFKTVNYPGSTIEYNSTKFQSKFGIDATLLDSPGIISLTPNSPDEQVTVDSLYYPPKFGTPNIIIVTADASQLSRHLLLVNQLLSSNFNVIVAVTMHDILNKKGFKIQKNKLAELLNCNVAVINARTGEGIDDLISIIKSELSKNEAQREIKKIKTEVDAKKILERYKEIEEIEHKVVIPIVDNKNIEVANSKLNVLSNSLVNKPDNFSLKLDSVLLHKFWGFLFFLVIMVGIFTSIFWLAVPLIDFVDESFSSLAGWAAESLGNTWYSDLIADGIIASLGAVLVFVPQIIILFLILGFLEDTGYLARGAMLIDKPLSKIGLNGRSFVPMLSGFACAIPAMMAARTISNKRERLLTLFIIPLMSCSARLPVYALLIAFLIPSNSALMGGILLAIIYFFSIVSSAVIAGIINKFSNSVLKANDNSSFILELPSYKLPKLKSVLRSTYTSSKQYVKEAGPVIIIFSAVLWALSYFPNPNPQIDESTLNGMSMEDAIHIERVSTSYAAELGKFIEPVMTPLGMDWRVGVSLISAFVAREVFVSSLAVMFRITGEEDDIRDSIIDAMRNAKIHGTNQKIFTPATIIGLAVFFVFALQCLTTVAVARKEMGGWRLPIIQLVFYTLAAYFATFVTVNGLRLLGIE